MPNVQDILQLIHQLAPAILAETWDNVGLLSGAPNQTVRRILLALDASMDIVRQARMHDCQLIITHHPVIFRPLKSLRNDNPIAALLSAAIRADISIIACHTNLDSMRHGVNETLAEGLGITRSTALSPAAIQQEGLSSACGLGRIGSYPQPISADDFLLRLREFCKPPWLLEAGLRPERISRVAVCGGSGSDLAEIAFNKGAQVYVTAEIKHSVARWAEAVGIWLIDAGHFATEQPGMPVFGRLLAQECSRHGFDLDLFYGVEQSPLRLVSA